MKGRGNYYKLKSKQWFIEKGYDCDYLERAQRVYVNKRVIPIKRDVFGADLIAMNEEEIIFANSKVGKKNIAKGLKEFASYKYPKFVKRWLLIWERRAREPEIIEYEEGKRDKKD